MHIGFDCDGVLRDFQTKSLELFLSDNPEYRDYFKTPLRWSGWDPRTTMKSFDKEVYEEFKRFLFGNPKTSYRVYRHAEPFDEVSDFSRLYKILKMSGCQVSICTSQGSPWQRVATVQWLEEKPVEFDNIILSDNDLDGKGSFNLDYHLDDKWQNVAEVDEKGGKGVMFLQRWNRDKTNRVKRYVETLEEFVDMVVSENS